MAETFYQFYCPQEQQYNSPELKSNLKKLTDIYSSPLSEGSFISNASTQDSSN